MRLRSRDTLSEEPRNRLCRAFGTSNFLVVRFDTPYLSPADKYAYHSGEPLFDKDSQQFINAQRLFSLFQPVTSGKGDDAAPLTQNLKPEAIWRAHRSERTDAFLNYQRSLAEYSKRPLQIADKEFKLLLTTSSGVHAQKYLYASLERKAILDWAMCHEDIEKLKSTPIKLALRLAMLNSTSVALGAISDITCTFVPDRYAKDRTGSSDAAHILTDGCGLISPSLARRVQIEYAKKQLPSTIIPKHECYQTDGSYQHSVQKAASLKPMTEVPSAFQIRFAGNKGMLVVAYSDEAMRGYDIIFSESMKKFTTPSKIEHATLEIMGFSFPSPSVELNTEVLDILVGNASDSESVFNFFKSRLDELLSDCKSQLDDLSATIKHAYDTGDRIGLRMHLLGFPPDVAFLCSVYARTLRPLHIPISKSCRLYGVADFQNVLTPGQIFVQYQGEVVEGTVLLLKEPCFSATDVQKFQAVDDARLRHLQNVIVFSTSPDCLTSDPSKVAGSDLDGDKFVCIWQPELVGLIAPKDVSNSQREHKDGRKPYHITNRTENRSDEANAHAEDQDIQMTTLETSEEGGNFDSKYIKWQQEKRKEKKTEKEKERQQERRKKRERKRKRNGRTGEHKDEPVWGIPEEIADYAEIYAQVEEQGLPTMILETSEEDDEFNSKGIQWQNKKGEERSEEEEEEDSVFSAVRKQCFFTAAHSLEYCTLADLLHLRLCMVDEAGANWTSRSDIGLLSTFLTDTVDAPKQSTWVPVDNPELQKMIASLPPVPHYHLQARSTNSQRSTSVRARLYDHCLSWLQQKMGLRQEYGLVQDFVDLHQAFVAADIQRADDELSSEVITKVLQRLERGVWERSNLIEYIAFYSCYWKFIVPGSFDASTERRILQATPYHLQETVRKDLSQRRYSEPNVYTLPDYRMWGTLEDEKSNEWVNILGYGETITTEPDSKRFWKMRIPFVAVGSEQEAAVRFVEELSFSERDAVWPVDRVIHNFRNERNFTPSYFLNLWAQKRMKRLFEFKLSRGHCYYDRIDACRRSIQAVRSTRSSMNHAQLRRVLTALHGRISNNGWEESEELVKATVELLRQTNYCIRYFIRYPPDGVRNSYSLKGSIERALKNGREVSNTYVSNVALAMDSTGCGTHATTAIE